jgi:hypothetical protein
MDAYVTCAARLTLPTAAFYARGLGRRCDFFLGCDHEAQACFVDPACTVVAFICPCHIGHCLKRNPRLISLGISIVAGDGPSMRRYGEV